MVMISRSQSVFYFPEKVLSSILSAINLLLLYCAIFGSNLVVFESKIEFGTKAGKSSNSKP